MNKMKQKFVIQEQLYNIGKFVEIKGVPIK